MTIKRVSRFAGVALVGALALAACGSDNNGTDARGRLELLERRAPRAP